MIKAYIYSCLSILRFGLVFAAILFGHQTRGFIAGMLSGHIGVTAFDGTSLGISLINLFGHLPMLGLTSAIDVLGVHALSNPQTQKETGIIVQRTLFICIFISLPIVSALLLIKPVLIFFHQDPNVLEVAASLLEISPVVVPINAVSLCMAKYLFIMNRKKVVVYSVVVTIGAALILLSVVAISLDASLLAIQWCYVFCELLQPLLLASYFLITKVHKASWDGFTIRGFTNWPTTMRSALPSSGLIFLEWGMYEIFLIIAGSRTIKAFWANALGFSGVLIGYLLQYGIGVSATKHISQSFAEGNISDTRKYIRSSLIACMISTIVYIGFGIAAKYFIVTLFLDFDELEYAYPWILCYIILDAYQIVMNGILRGSKRNILPMIITVSSFIFSLVVGSLLALRLHPTSTFYTPGIWMGLCGGGFLCNAGLTAVLMRTKMEGNADATAVYSVQDDGSELAPVVELETLEDEPDEGQIEHENRRLQPKIDSAEFQHILMTKGGLFFVGVICVITAAIANLTNEQLF